MSAPRYWIEFTDDWRRAPIAFWAHIPADGKHWYAAQQFIPPSPERIPHKGYRVLCVDFDGIVLYFSSRAQVEECIRVLAAKPMPTVRQQLQLKHNGKGGLNSHWLSRFPFPLKRPKGRALVVKSLERILADKAIADFR